MSTQPNQALIDEKVPCIKIGGRDWPIPPLGPKQNAVVVPTILAIIPDVLEIVRRRATEEPSLETLETQLAQTASILNEENLLKLSDVVFAALKKGHKELTRDEFDDMPLGVMECIDAILVISQQTGLIRPARPGEVPITAGEAKAVAENSPTGTL